MTDFLSQLNWRNATKKFDPAKPVSPDKLAQVLAAIRMAPTSFGLQPFEVHVVKNAALKDTLKASGWGQEQFAHATAVLVFVADTKVTERIDRMLDQRSGGDPAARAAMKDYEGMMKGWAKELSPEAAKAWAQKQCYIGLGFGLAACAELGIDSCPMEGFVPPEFDKALGLAPHLFSSVALAIGTAPEGYQPFPKWRFSNQEIFKEH